MLRGRRMPQVAVPTALATDTGTMVEPSLSISVDGQVAALELPSGLHLVDGALQELLAKHRIVHGLQAPAEAAAARTALMHRRLVVAQGDPPRPGRDGWVEPLVREPEAVYAAGTVDLRDLHHFREVAAGTPLLRLHSPEEGTPGRTVQGDAVPARPGRSADLSPCFGQGCARAEGDDHLVVAAIDGLYQRFTRGGRPFVQVSARVEIPGDVDMTIGHIDTRFPILVQGDIRVGFLVKTVADLEVLGSVEDARCSARGDIHIHGGLLPGRQRIKAHGDVQVRHVQNREIKARHVIIEHGCLASVIRATGSVSAREIIGGEVHAAAGVICDLLGDPTGTATLVQVGVDPYEESLFAWATARLPDLAWQRDDLRQRGHLLAYRVHTLLSAGEDHHSEDAALRALVAEAAKLHAEEERCQAIIAQHPLRLHKAQDLERHATVMVRRYVLPGTVIAIGSARLQIKERMDRVTFRWHEGAVIPV